ncbi:unnamed protein product [Darwinula stevensoni]|uniref:RING-type domain-containing protein n=1 Tax=Darwinula stevensoni TaxID=69355 RepID=A0A7R9A4D2_9CRUS|nr:unnamed protein product [Darwinula stevensoni]CAG0892321.1 unnamed protein product [Darwinula stevensoni]
MANFLLLLIPLPVASLLLLLFFVVFWLVKRTREGSRVSRHCLPPRSLANIPTATYKKGHTRDTCAICLEDYEKGERLRVLPCSHAFHSECVDPWLTKRKQACPCCNRTVQTPLLARDENTCSESSSEDERKTSSLRGDAREMRRNGGTFISSVRLSHGRSGTSSSRPSSAALLAHTHRDSLGDMPIFSFIRELF